MAVFREMTIEYEGQKVVVTPSNRLLRRIDAELHPLTAMGVLGNMQDGHPPIPALACIVSHLLQAGGLKVDEDQVYLDMLEDAKTGGENIRGLVAAIATALGLADGEGVAEAVGEAPGKSKGAGKKSKG